MGIQSDSSKRHKRRLRTILFGRLELRVSVVLLVSVNPNHNTSHNPN